MIDITVVTPTHPGRSPDLLDRAVRSVINQTRPPTVHLVRWDHERRGAAYTRHHALMDVRTSWTAFLDSDDEFHANHLHRLSDEAERTGADYVYSWFKIIGGGDPFPLGHFLDPWDDARPRHTTIVTLVRTELAQRVGFWTSDDRHVGGGEDWYFTCGMMALGAKIYHVPERTWNWYHHGMNTSGQPGRGDAL